MGRSRIGTRALILALIVGFCSVSFGVSIAKAEVKTGLISVRTGVSFKMVDGTLDYQLYGVGTCAAIQVAHLNGVAWPCGAVATGWFTMQTLGLPIECLEEGRAADQYATILARCFLPTGEDIAKLALEEGLAWVIHHDGQPIVRDYEAIEQEARNERRGLWSSNFLLNSQLFRP